MKNGLHTGRFGRNLLLLWSGATALVLIVFVIAFFVLWHEGFSSRPQPSELEATLAMKAYDGATPDRFLKMRNPLASHGVDLVEAGGHYQEHCAACHGDNGNGEPKFRGVMYPRPADLRSGDAQEMSDGQPYWVIKNGVRWTGMPAFGKPGDDDEHVWKIVAYVRHLPKMTAAEQQQVLQQAEQPMKHDEHMHDHAEGGASR